MSFTALAAAEVYPCNGRLVITVISVRNLHDKNLIGKMSPFVELYLGGEKQQTEVAHHAGVNAEFNHAVIFNVNHNSTELLRVLTKNKELVGSEHIGEVTLQLHDIIHAHQGTVWIETKDHKDFAKVAGDIQLNIEWTGTPASNPSLASPAAAHHRAGHHHENKEERERYYQQQQEWAGKF